MTYTPTLTRGFGPKPKRRKSIRKIIGEKLRSARLTRVLPGAKDPAMAKTLEDRVEWVKGYSARFEKPIKQRLDILNVHDLITHYPRDYYQRVPLKELREGELLETQGKIVSIERKTTRGRRMKLVEVIIEDQLAEVKVTFFNQAWVMKRLKMGSWMRVLGRCEYGWNEFAIKPQNFEIFHETLEPIADGGEAFLRPLYPLSEGLSNGKLSTLIWRGLEEYSHLFPEAVEQNTMKKLALMPVPEALRQIHRPKDIMHAEAARTSLKFREFYLLESGLAFRHREMKADDNDLIFQADEALRQRGKQLFPFDFTGAQKRVIGEIVADLTTPGRMNRLIQGDVGCGKTAVALYGMLVAQHNGVQSAMLAPTEILARQHFRNLSEYLEGSGVTIELLTGSTSTQEKRRVRAAVKAGEVDFLIGTHAILEKSVSFKRLGLVVIDEQHKFGVKQRAKLLEKGNKPHRLVMSATPIPRTLSLTVYGDLSLSVIDELPPGRKPVVTSWVPDSARIKTLAQIKELMAKGNQVYFISPLVKPSAKIELQSAEESYADMKRFFGAENVAMVHGQMSNDEKEANMKRFADGDVKLLVATVVVEVGVDVPTANVMVIDHAERFGLSQLHQLRGRIGRGGGEAKLFLFGNPNTEEGVQRLSVLCKTSDGFKIAEEDLKLRGFGDFIGTRQSGMPRLKLGNPVEDMKLLSLARNCAFGHTPDAQEAAELKHAIQLSFGSQFDTAAGA